MNLGVISALSGPRAAVGKSLIAGAETWFKFINSNGGIAGRYQVKLKVQDSQNRPDLALQEYEQIKDHSILIEQMFGTSTTKAALPLLRKDGVVAAPATLDGDWVNDPNLIPVGVPYQTEMINGADYLVHGRGLGTKRFCSLTERGPYGAAAQAGIDFAGFRLGYRMITVARYSVGDRDLTAQIKQLAASRCQVVFLVSAPDITYAALTAALSRRFAPTWLGTAATYVPALADGSLKAYMTSHYFVVLEGAELDDLTSKGATDLRSRQIEFAPDQMPDQYFEFGYVQAWAVSQVLEKAVALGDLSRVGITRAMAKVGTLTFDGLTSPYEYGPPEARRAGRANSVYRINPAKAGALESVAAPFVSQAARDFAMYTSTP